MTERNFMEDILVPLFAMMICCHVLGWIYNIWFIIPGLIITMPVMYIIFKLPTDVKGETE